MRIQTGFFRTFVENHKKMKLYIFLYLLGLSLTASAITPEKGAGTDELIPEPKEVRIKSDRLRRITDIVTTIDSDMHIPDEGYTLEVRGKKVILRAKDHSGLIHARATLAQLAGAGPDDFMNSNALRGSVIPDVEIRDWPSFPIRGFMHDTGRNFREVETLKKEIDLFAFYKLSVFHWHLTDNPAWRIECHAYPQLNDPEFQRQGRDEGRFYTYDQIREIFAYAAERGITVIPEIDMPGHSQYFDRTFGFKMASEQGMKVLEICLKEFMNEIPADICPYIHIGSDEVKIADPKGFMEFCERIVTEGGRTPLAWMPGLPASECTISQIWTEKGKMSIGKDFHGRYIDSYMGYLNHGNSITNTARMFLHQLCSVPEHDGRAMGGILCLWNDVRSDDKSRIFPHNGMPECLLSFSQSCWKGGEGYGPEAHKALIGFERKIALHREHFLKNWNMRWVANAHIPWKVKMIPPSGSDCRSFEAQTWGGCVDLNEICRANGVIPGKERLTAVLTTEIHVERDTVITAWVGFDTPSRSNRRSDGIGEQGKWEWSGRIFSGETEIFPPEPWNEPGKYRYHHNTWNRPPNEEPYTDEQLFWMRKPAYIPLKAGWNTIRMECPRVFDANVWMAAFVPLVQDADGRVSEAIGITYR